MKICFQSKLKWLKIFNAFTATQFDKDSVECQMAYFECFFCFDRKNKEWEKKIHWQNDAKRLIACHWVLQSCLLSLFFRFNSDFFFWSSFAHRFISLTMSFVWRRQISSAFNSFLLWRWMYAWLLFPFHFVSFTVCAWGRVRWRMATNRTKTLKYLFSSFHSFSFAINVKQQLLLRRFFWMSRKENCKWISFFASC